MHQYCLEHHHSHLGVAFFAPRLRPCPGLTAIIDLVAATPNDAFLRAEARRILATAGTKAIQDLAQHPDLSRAALALETVLLNPGLAALSPLLATPRLAELAAASPLVFLRNRSQADAETHRAWSLALADAVFQGRPLPLDLPPLPTAPAFPRTIDPATLQAQISFPDPAPRPPLPEVLHRALSALETIGVLAGPELRHQASLAPVGLTRSWRLQRSVVHGRLSYTLQGTMTSYGRGTTLEAARVSLAMEIVERVCSFASVEEDHIPGLVRGGTVRTARATELEAPALDLNTLCLEAPAPDAPLAWMPATTALGATIWVPVQAVFLFANLDEPKLFGALGSTGLASGSTFDEARRAGLLEVLERDAEITSPWNPERAFRPRSRTPLLQRLLAAYRAQGVDLILHDITTEFGIPAFKALVPLPGGGFAKATAADLCGPHAALAAITEVPFPFPHGPASATFPSPLPERHIEDLPDLSTGSASGDVRLLEAILSAHGYEPIYADLTRDDIGIPVVRALVPGLETATDLDEFSRISPRLAAAAAAALGQRTLPEP